VLFCPDVFYLKAGEGGFLRVDRFTITAKLEVNQSVLRCTFAHAYWLTCGKLRTDNGVNTA
jgi:hypothetical protein